MMSIQQLRTQLPKHRVHYGIGQIRGDESINAVAQSPVYGRIRLTHFHRFIGEFNPAVFPLLNPQQIAIIVKSITLVQIDRCAATGIGIVGTVTYISQLSFLIIVEKEMLYILDGKFQSVGFFGRQDFFGIRKGTLLLT